MSNSALKKCIEFKTEKNVSNLENGRIKCRFFHLPDDPGASVLELLPSAPDRKSLYGMRKVEKNQRKKGEREREKKNEEENEFKR